MTSHAFAYKAKTSEGAVIRGRVYGPDAMTALGAEALKGLFVYTIKPLSTTAASPWWQRILHALVRPRGHERLAQEAQMMHILGMVLTLPLPMDEALSSVLLALPSAADRRIVEEALTQVVQGMPLPEALALGAKNQGRPFDAATLAYLMAGSEAGRYGPFLTALGDVLKAQSDQMHQWRGDMLYPLATFLVTMTLGWAMITVGIPWMTQFLTSLGAPLPPLIRGVLTLQEGLKTYGLWLQGAMILSLLGWGIIMLRAVSAQKLYGPSENWRMMGAWLRLKLPWVGPMIAAHNWQRGALLTQGLLQAKVPLLRALNAGAQGMTNLYIRQAYKAAIDKLESQGTPLGQSLEKMPPLPHKVMVTHVGYLGATLGDYTPAFEMLAATMRTYNQQAHKKLMMGVKLGLLGLSACMLITAILGLYVPLYSAVGGMR